MQLLLQPRVTHPARHKMLARVQININDCRVWSFFNEIGALAQCPHNWGVGSAFHPMKIQILVIIGYPVIKVEIAKEVKRGDGLCQ